MDRSLRIQRARGVLVPAVILVSAPTPRARNNIRSTFFDVYPEALGTQLEGLPSNPKHCGVCHFDFDGGGQRNPFGLSVEVGLSGGLSNLEAILAADGIDSDGDGFINRIEASDTVNFTNTPTFPGLNPTNYTSTLNVLHDELVPYLYPSGSTDSISQRGNSFRSAISPTTPSGSTISMSTYPVTVEPVINQLL